MATLAVAPAPAGAPNLVVRQSVLRRRADPRHIRLTVEMAKEFANPKYPLVRLGDLLSDEIKYGTSHRLVADPGQYPVLRMNNLTVTGCDTASLKYLDASPEEAAPFLLQPSDLLVNRSNSLPQVGKAAVFNLPGDWLFASFLLRLRLETARVVPDFVALFLNSPSGRLQLERLARPILGMANISPTEFRSILIPLPPTIGEQDALLRPLRQALGASRQAATNASRLLLDIIADFEDLVGPLPAPAGVAATFTTTTRSLRAADRLAPEFFNPERAAMLQAVIDLRASQPKKLSTVADFIEVRAEPAAGETVLALSSVESHSGRLLEDGDDVSAGRRYAKGDVLFGRLRPYLNKVAVATDDGVCSPEFYVLRPKLDITAEYLALAMRSVLVLGQVRHMVTGNTHPRVAKEDAETILVPVPERAIQDELATRMADRRAEAARIRTEADEEVQRALAAFTEALLE